MLALIYAILIVYGSLYPFSGWTVPQQPFFSFLTAAMPAHSSRSDLLTNVLAYIPFGMLLALGLNRRSKALSVVLATVLGATLSFLMESAQMFLPSRTSSNVDWLTNIAGALLGALLASLLGVDSLFRRNFRQARRKWFEDGPGIDIALIAALLWIASQWSPFVPSMDVSTVWGALNPLRSQLSGYAFVSLARTASYAFNIAGLALMMAVVARRRPTLTSLAFILTAGFVIAAKPLIVTRQLSLEPIYGLLCATAAVALLPRARALRTMLAMLFVLTGFAISELHAGTGGGLHSFNWIPFAGELDDTVSGFGSILESTWPFVALAALSILGFGRKRGTMLSVGSILCGLVFVLEWSQRGIDGRYGDITTVLLAAAGWLLSWAYSFMMPAAPAETRTRDRYRSRQRLSGSNWREREKSVS